MFSSSEPAGILPCCAWGSLFPAFRHRPPPAPPGQEGSLCAARKTGASTVDADLGGAAARLKPGGDCGVSRSPDGACEASSGQPRRRHGQARTAPQTGDTPTLSGGVTCPAADNEERRRRNPTHPARTKTGRGARSNSRLRARSGFGSGSPPDCHSLPNPFASRTPAPGSAVKVSPKPVEDRRRRSASCPRGLPRPASQASPPRDRGRSKISRSCAAKVTTNMGGRGLAALIHPYLSSPSPLRPSYFEKPSGAGKTHPYRA